VGMRISWSKRQLSPNLKGDLFKQFDSRGFPQGTYPDDTRKNPWSQPSNPKAAADISLKCICRAAP
jgi:hypothetical protein